MPIIEYLIFGGSKEGALFINECTRLSQMKKFILLAIIQPFTFRAFLLFIGRDLLTMLLAAL